MRDFLEWVFPLGHQTGDKEYLHGLLWCAPAKRSFWSTDVDALVKRAKTWEKQKQNVYFGVGMSSAPPKQGRGKLHDITAIPCLWADIDYGKPEGAGGRKYAPNEAAALRFVDGLPVRPSILTHTGHGLQGFWLLDAPEVFFDPQARDEAAGIARGWIAYLNSQAAKMGFSLDPVGDLTRVMRLPGPPNVKGDPVPTRVIYPEKDPPRYSIDVLKARGGACLYGASARQPASVEVPDVIVVPAVVEALQENNDKFRETWAGNRDKSWSPSEYDLSIASIMAEAKIPDQDIAQAILAFRHKMGWAPEKARRKDYLDRTISRAKSASAVPMARKARTAAVEKATEGIQDASTDIAPDRREKLLKHLSVFFGLPIARIIKHGRENSRYSFVAPDGRETHIGTSDQLLSQSWMRARMVDASDSVLERAKADKWDDIIKAVIEIAEFVELRENERHVEVSDWLAEYFVERGCTRVEEDKDATSAAIMSSEPILQNGHAYVNARAFGSFVRSLTGTSHPNNREVQSLLRLAGFEEGASMQTRWNGRNIHRRYWRGPVPAGGDF